MGIKYFFTVVVCLSVGLTQAQDLASHYKIYDSYTKTEVSLAELLRRSAKADVLFFGEEHNDSIGHCLEALILQKLTVANPQKVALSMEMFHRDVQPILDEYLAGAITEKNFTKEARAWSNYQDYRPMIELAKKEGIKVIGGNAAARYSNTVTTKGLAALAQFPTASLKFFAPLPIDTATGRYLEKFKETLGSHNMGNMKVYQTQNFWDATMAYSIASFKKANPDTKVLQLNGRFHSDEQLGTFAKLKQYAPRLLLMNISCFTASDFEHPNWDAYQSLGNFVIITDPQIKRTY